MSAQPKSAQPLKQAKQEVEQEDLDQIMNEIQTLQKGMAEAPHAHLHAVPSTPAPSAEEEDVTDIDAVAEVVAKVAAEVAEEPIAAAETSVAAVEAPKAATPAVAPAPSEDDEFAALIAQADDADSTPVLQEFRGSAGDASMDDALGSLKEEPSASGKSIFDEEGSKAESPAETAAPATAVTASAPSSTVSDPVSLSKKEIPMSRVMAAVDSAPKTQAQTEGELSLQLKGSMTLKIKYDFAGQEVTIGFDDNCLKVQLSDGTEFKIPVRAK